MTNLVITAVQPGKELDPQPGAARLILQIPPDPEDVRGFQDFLNWLKDNPDFLMMLIQAFLLLLGGIAPPPKRR